MAHDSWSDDENDKIVADYFSILIEELSGSRANKAEHRRALQPFLNQRSEGAIEFKHQNISAVLKGLGETWILGYKPAVNIQTALIDAVYRWLVKNPNWMSSVQKLEASGFRDAEQLFVGPAPTLSNQEPPKEAEQMQLLARKFDVAKRDEANRELGFAGEELVLHREKSLLTGQGRADLAEKVRWVSQSEGDGLGYDIASFEPDGRRRLIEVKTTNGWERTPFYITRNEVDVAEQNREDWCLFRLWNFARVPKAFEIRPPLERHVSLTAETFKASFH